jgi:2-amino-4-hydroxy-6-hydroxymethyldihydropteridine diphosphokinase
MNGKYLLLGTNIGNRFQNLRSALGFIEEHIGKVIKQSSIFETEAWGYRDQPAFYNQVLEIETSNTPEELLKLISEIEKKMGRARVEKWKERLIDIDILYYDNSIIQKPELTIPHPEIHKRRFTLIPLCEISPHEIHPLLKKTNIKLLEETTDNLKVKKIKTVS